MIGDPLPTRGIVGGRCLACGEVADDPAPHFALTCSPVALPPLYVDYPEAGTV